MKVVAGGGRQWLSSEGFDHRGRDYDICKRGSLRFAAGTGGDPGTRPNRMKCSGDLEAKSDAISSCCKTLT